MFVCVFCKFVTSNERHIRNHIFRNHSDMSYVYINNNSYVGFCLFCKKKVGKTVAVKHARKCRSNPKSTSLCKHKCNICDHELETMFDLRRHLSFDHGLGILQKCYKCKRYFGYSKWKYFIQKHVKRCGFSGLL